jgi:hypothetical protein
VLAENNLFFLAVGYESNAAWVRETEKIVGENELVAGPAIDRDRVWFFRFELNDGGVLPFARRIMIHKSRRGHCDMTNLQRCKTRATLIIIIMPT